MTPLNDSELDRLDHFLRSEATPAACMTLSELDGFLTALLVGPHLMPPSQWLNEVWRESEEAPMVFASNTQMEEIFDLIIRLYNQRALELAETQAFVPILNEYEKDGVWHLQLEDWCQGFMTGVRLDADGWAPLFDDEEHLALLTPMLLFGTDAGLDERNKKPEINTRIDEFSALLTPCAIALREFWHKRAGAASPLRRASPNLGRNESCPCGSGKKFKKCCGRPEKLH